MLARKCVRDSGFHTALVEFAADPIAYDLSEMCPEAERWEMAVACEAMQEELYRTKR